LAPRGVPPAARFADFRTLEHDLVTAQNVSRKTPVAQHRERFQLAGCLSRQQQRAASY
jgi:hypothetical protein